MRVPEIQSQKGLTKKFVSLGNFHEVLVKRKKMDDNIHSQQQDGPGFACPVCGCFITFAIDDILHKSEIVCPCCYTRLSMDRTQAESSMPMKNKDFSTGNLTGLLDKEFEIEKNPENLLEFAITDLTREYINPEFLNQTTGFLLKGSEVIKKVYSVVFVTDNIIEKLNKEKDCLIFTHHHFNYYEDERGLQALNENQIQKILDPGNSLYVAHAPLDTHPKYGTSKSLAKLCNIVPEKLFFDYFGAPTALTGQIEPTGFDDFAEFVRSRLARPVLTLHKYHEDVHKIGVVAGGGDMPEILQEVYDNGCDTLFTGTIEHRWDIPFVQEQNKKFHDLNKKLELNLIGGTHYGTERPAMFYVKELFDGIGIDFEYCEDDDLLNAL